MLPRNFINPKDHWVTDPVLPYSQAVRCGNMLFVTGQVDLDRALEITCPGDLEGQTRAAMNDLAGVLHAAGMSPSDLVQLRGFYVQDGTVDENSLAVLIGKCLGILDGPGPVLTLVPLGGLMSPGVLFEIEAIAMRGQNGEALPRTAAFHPDLPDDGPAFSHAIRVGEMLFTTGMTARDKAGHIASPGDLTAQSTLVVQQLDGLLRQLGADIHDTVKTNIFNAEPGNAEDWATPALTRASFYPDPGPAATGISVPSLWPDELMLKNDVIAMRGVDGARLSRSHVWPDDHWDWPVHLPYRHGIRCGDLVFLGGQVPLNPDASVAHAGDPVAQTNMAMEYIRRVLAELGMDFGNVLRINTFYAGASDDAVWKPNLHARFAHFQQPGPATTGIPVPYLAYEDMGIEIDVVAMA